MLKIRRATRTIRIALVVPPPQKPGPIWCPNLPIGLAYLAAVLEKSGHDVTVIDCQALGIDHKRLGTKIATLEPSVVGITCVTPTIHSALLATHVVKETRPDTIVILGGQHVTFMDDQILCDHS